MDIEQEKADLLATDEEFAKTSLEKGAAEAFLIFLAKDAIQMNQGAPPVEGRDNIYESMKQSTVDYTLAWDPQHADVAAAGDMGWTWGWYTLSYIDSEGKAQEQKGKYLNVWRKDEEGNWRVVVDMGN